MFCDNNYNTNKGPNELVYALLQRSLWLYWWSND
jgi:hypothetical protein